MDQNKFSFLLRFPYLIEIKPNVFHGIHSIKGQNIEINLSCPQFPALIDVRLKVTGCMGNIQCDTDGYENVMDYLEAVEGEIERINAKSLNAGVKMDRRRIQTMKSLLRQLTTIDDRNLVELAPDLETITIKNFPDYPGHFLKLAIQNSGHFKIMDHSLPDCIKLTVTGTTLMDYINHFEMELSAVEEFYGNLLHFDEICFIIAPVPATTKFNYRIFKFDEKVFLKVTLDPYVPSKVQLNFIGPDDDVQRLRRVYNDRIGDWDMELNVHKNLLRIFDLTFFPYRPDCDPDHPVDHQNCSICFEFDLDNTFPIITCFNRRCEVIFHVLCLKRWFATQNEAKTFCTVTSGSCPYCKQKLTTFLEICDEE